MKKGILFLVAVLFLTSCSEKTYLTGSLMNVIKENQLPLNKIQFYNDNPVNLERELNASDANVKSGKIVIVNGKSINQIALFEQTPGVLVKEANNQLLVSFEEGGNESKSLHFAPVPGNGGESFYQLVDENGSPTFSRLSYDGNKYLMYSTKKVRLMIMKSTFSGQQISRKKMSGNRVK